MSRNNGVALAKTAGRALMRCPEEYVAPRADIVETAREFVLKVDMPGAPKDSVEVFLDGDLLTTRGSVGGFFDQNTATILVSEIRKAQYYRVFVLGQGIERDSLKAEYEDGVLMIHVPKSAEMMAHEIPIHYR